MTPEEIVDAYLNANRALYGVNRELYQDIEAAQILGMSEDALYSNMENRGERKAFNALLEGEFRPLRISPDVKELFEIKAQAIGMANPFEAAEDVLARIKDVLEAVPVSGDFFPDLDNPFTESMLPDVVSALNNQLPPLPNPALNTGLQFGNVNTNVNAADQYAALFPGDETGKLIKQRQTTNQNVMRQT